MAELSSDYAPGCDELATLLSHDDDTPVNTPTEFSFAQEVRTDRLNMLWKATLFFVVAVFWTFVVASAGEVQIIEFGLPPLMMATGCVLTARLLKAGHFNAAVWTYALGSILGVALAMAMSGIFAEQNAAFLFPLIVFIVGLLIPVRSTILLLAIVIAAALGGPGLINGTWEPNDTTIYALLLTLIATALSAQMSGELYAVAEWALDNYRRERRSSNALFESREALEKSFHRQRALTEQVRHANVELELSRKAEEDAKNFRGQFLANMSHELRTPLNAIIGFSQTMLEFPTMYDDVHLPPQYHQDMGQILASGQHLLRIINDILDLSKVDAGKLDLDIQPFDLGSVLDGVLSTAVGLVGDKTATINLLHDLPDPLPVVYGDPLRVRQVLLNLYSNAAKFTDRGYIKLCVTVADREVIFAVEDSGIGIDDADKATIFEEFRQGTAGRKKGRQGAGLGLAISQQLLRLMNGQLWFESALGQGSTFYFSLPRCILADAADPSLDCEQVPSGVALH